MKTLFKSNTSPLTYNVNKNTKISSVIDLTEFKKVVDEYKGAEDYSKLNDALDLIEDDDTLVTVGLKMFDKFSEAELDEIISEVNKVADRLKEIENGTNTDNVNRIDFQNDMKKVIKNTNGLKLVFGKNKDGKATASVMQGYQIILQLNSGNVYTLNDFVNDNTGNLADYAHKIKEALK
ncbi:hypothetical protein [Clostridium beijerinckii]|uniref:Phage protein n=2 Tax=Clostridium beijerinckii TaxID=1520 RepID=A0AAW3WB86_CLOBE|nr:hypothetical protein [Clostridium beijerinckii]MBC2476169.1 hypothetical protein [Clostridium beijerinckii]MDG5855253.1 hypothetical protein [Clostridium beijerinckii]NOV58578.1 hypothetical protein [Clostridium beijerinckii]NOV72040.1 hypothetical protein [Clostridium beijerinckii]NOW31933.1 hypothetical protein [Clostridium beijerinckii]